MTHRCKFPKSDYLMNSVFSCNGCGRTYVLTANWIERPAWRQRTSQLPSEERKP